MTGMRMYIEGSSRLAQTPELIGARLRGRVRV